MVLTAATLPEEVPLPTNRSTRGVDVSALFLASTSVTDGAGWDAEKFDEPHPVETIKASNGRMRERDTRRRWLTVKCTTTPYGKLLPGRACRQYLGILASNFQENEAGLIQSRTCVMKTQTQ
jgi:hypothetical protein